MTDPGGTSIAQSSWAPLLDTRRLQHDQVIGLLRRLARQAVAHFFAEGPRPALSNRDIRLLLPFLGGMHWPSGRRLRAIRRLESALQLSQLDGALRDNDLGLIMVASTQPASPFEFPSVHRATKRSALIGGATLLRVFEEIAWSQPVLIADMLGDVHAAWRRTTLFHNDEPDWPDRLSTQALRVIICAALDREAPGVWQRLFSRGRSKLLASLEASIAGVGPDLAERPLVEQLIVLESVKRADRQVRDALLTPIRVLPISAHAGYTELLGEGTPLQKNEMLGGKQPLSLQPVLDRIIRRAL